MRLSTRLSENTSAKSTGWPKWRENVQKHVSYFERYIEKLQKSPQFDLDAQNVGTQIFPDAFHVQWLQLAIKPTKTIVLLCFRDIFVFSPL